MALAADFSVILVQMWDSSAVNMETRRNGNLAPSDGICNFNTRIPDGPEYRIENSKDTLRDYRVYNETKIENTEK
jgi:hypothetical protein